MFVQPAVSQPALLPEVSTCTSSAPEAQRAFHVRVNCRADLENELERGVLQLRAIAQTIGDRGILITRHSPYEFVLELHNDVPFGQTLEKRCW
jgi:hypothetical protein